MADLNAGAFIDGKPDVIKEKEDYLLLFSITQGQLQAKHSSRVAKYALLDEWPQRQSRGMVVPTSLSQGILGLLVVCSQVGNGMQGCRSDGVVGPLPDQADQPLHCIITQHLGLQQDPPDFKQG